MWYHRLHTGGAKQLHFGSLGRLLGGRAPRTRSWYHGGPFRRPIRRYPGIHQPMPVSVTSEREKVSTRVKARYITLSIPHIFLNETPSGDTNDPCIYSEDITTITSRTTQTRITASRRPKRTASTNPNDLDRWLTAGQNAQSGQACTRISRTASAFIRYLGALIPISRERTFAWSFEGYERGLLNTLLLFFFFSLLNFGLLS